MIHIVPQWKIGFEYSDRTVTFWLHSNSVSNVLRAVADMQFSENGLEQPLAIHVGRVEKQNPSTNVTTSVST